jgi:hypothetical protein
MSFYYPLRRSPITALGKEIRAKMLPGDAVYAIVVRLMVYTRLIANDV